MLKRLNANQLKKKTILEVKVTKAVKVAPEAKVMKVVKVAPEVKRKITLALNVTSSLVISILSKAPSGTNFWATLEMITCTVLMFKMFGKLSLKVKASSLLEVPPLVTILELEEVTKSTPFHGTEIGRNGDSLMLETVNGASNPTNGTITLRCTRVAWTTRSTIMKPVAPMSTSSLPELTTQVKSMLILLMATMSSPTRTSANPSATSEMKKSKAPPSKMSGLLFTKAMEFTASNQPIPTTILEWEEEATKSILFLTTENGRNGTLKRSKKASTALKTRSGENSSRCTPKVTTLKLTPKLIVAPKKNGTSLLLNTLPNFGLMLFKVPLPSRVNLKEPILATTETVYSLVWLFLMSGLSPILDMATTPCRVLPPATISA
mmetsp:Transcript_16176/g.13737  ORF Transcript_16176/g.13737 Transcript_16176/m.13737 type:complete len:378 (+) Transcript_16176:470-1603(+)